MDSLRKAGLLPSRRRRVSFKSWSERLTAYAGGEALRGELPYWQEQLKAGGLAELPRDHAVESGFNRDTAALRCGSTGR